MSIYVKLESTMGDKQIQDPQKLGKTIPNALSTTTNFPKHTANKMSCSVVSTIHLPSKHSI